MSQSSGNLLPNLILFGRILRELGINSSPGRIIDLARALKYIDIENKSDFYHTARSLLVYRQEDIPVFDLAFELFWRKPLEASDLHFHDNINSKPNQPQTVPPPLQAPDSKSESENEKKQLSEEDDDAPLIEVTVTYSTREVLRHKDFADLTNDELNTMKQLISEISWKLGTKRTRRWRAGAGARVNMRRTLRMNFSYGAEILRWAYQKPVLKPRPLVVIADISGSMERYTRLLLQFILTLSAGLDQQIEAFVFSTHLTRITRQLDRYDVDRTLDDISSTVTDWSGGTRIGYALKTFNFDWGRRVLRRGAIILIISDGWDKGDIDLLGEEMARLQRNCYRLIWLNPLLGSSEYEPLTRGIQAALPYIDDFLPVHNLESLENLAEHIQGLGSRRLGL